MGDAFYEQIDEDLFRSTRHTAGPWTQEAQHMGPPSALLARAFERCAPRPDTALARLAFEVLGPVPLTELRVRAWVERPGRAVELLSAELSTAERTVVRAHAWRIAASDTAHVAAGAEPPLDGPEHGEPMPIPDGWQRGYLDATEWRALTGGLATGIGHARVWGRPRVELVAGEQISALQGLCSIADSANGVANRLDIRSWLYINTDLTLHLHRAPEGGWFGLDARSVIGPTGQGSTHAVLFDERGAVGHGAQSLLVRHV